MIFLIYLKNITNNKGQIAKANDTLIQDEVILTRLTKEKEELLEQRDNRPQEAITIDETHAKCKQQEKAETEKIISQLTKIGEKMPAKGKESQLIESLNIKKTSVSKLFNAAEIFSRRNSEPGKENGGFVN